MDYDFEICKYCAASSGVSTYKITDRVVVYVCSSCRFHYINYLDDIESLTSHSNRRSIDSEDFEYIAGQLQYNLLRFTSQVELISSYLSLEGAQCLDIGAGGGVFLHLLQQRGAEVYGIEPNKVRVQFARQRYNINLSEHTVEHPYWQENFKEMFDVVTLWDVIEHVNFPLQTLHAAVALIRPGGLLCLDTPARDSFYHQLGEITYRVSRGRYPTFLNMMYSNKPFAHKQIFSGQQLFCAVKRSGLDVIKMARIHELSFPYTSYLERILKSKRLAKLAGFLVSTFFTTFKIRNKVILVARKVSPSQRSSRLSGFTGPQEPAGEGSHPS